jgi:hypothetical protein
MRQSVEINLREGREGRQLKGIVGVLVVGRTAGRA